MKKIFALILVCAYTLTACSKTENTKIPHSSVNSSSSDTVSSTVSSAAENGNSDPLSEPTADGTSDNSSDGQSDPDPEQENVPVHIEDIHEPDEENELYNINSYYDLSDRYYMPFGWLNEPAPLWYDDESNTGHIGEKYDPGKAVEYAKAHWDDDLDLCAPFISRCMNVGGLSIGSDSSTALCLMLAKSRLGVGQFLPMNKDATVTLPDYARPGDIIQEFCPYEGVMIHTMIYVGDDKNGRMKACAHNPKSSGRYTFKFDRECFRCLTKMTEVYYFHFFDDDEATPEPVIDDPNIILFDSTGYTIPNQHYDRKSAAEFAAGDPIDGIGRVGAEWISEVLSAGGLDIGSHNQTALFVQLLKSRLGAVYTVPINPNRTVTLPEFVKEGDICFLYCPDEFLFYSSFAIKGADRDGKMIGFTRDKLNSESSAFRVESICPSDICESEITEVLIFHFAD